MFSPARQNSSSSWITFDNFWRSLDVAYGRALITIKVWSKAADIISIPTWYSSGIFSNPLTAAWAFHLCFHILQVFASEKRSLRSKAGGFRLTLCILTVGGCGAKPWLNPAWSTILFCFWVWLSHFWHDVSTVALLRKLNNRNNTLFYRRLGDMIMTHTRYWRNI